MADASDLYPKPVQQQQNVLSQDPAHIVNMLNGINQLKLFNQQFPALSEQPAAALQGANISNQTAQMQQNDAATKIVAGYLGSLPDDAKPDDVYRMKAAIRAVHPNISAQTINTVADVMLQDPKGMKNGLATMRIMAIPQSEAVNRVPGTPTETGAPTQQPLSAAIRGGTNPIGLSPRETAAQTTSGSGAGTAVNDARLHSLNYNQQVFPLEQAIPALEKLGKRGTGPGAEEFNHIKSFLQTAGIPGFDAEKIKNFDEAKKYLTDFIRQNGDTSSNDRLAAAFAGSPSVGISNAAAVDVAKAALSLRRFKQAQLVAFEKSGKSDEDFPKEAGKWAREHDPRVYGFDMMTPDQRRKVIESLPSGRREMFMMDVNDALANGIIKAPK